MCCNSVYVCVVLVVSLGVSVVPGSSSPGWLWGSEELQSGGWDVPLEPLATRCRTSDARSDQSDHMVRGIDRDQQYMCISAFVSISGQ